MLDPRLGAVFFGVVESAEPFDLQVGIVSQVVGVVGLHVFGLADKAGGGVENPPPNGRTGAGPDKPLPELEGVSGLELTGREGSSSGLGLSGSASLAGGADARMNVVTTSMEGGCRENLRADGASLGRVHGPTRSKT